MKDSFGETRIDRVDQVYTNLLSIALHSDSSPSSITDERIMNSAPGENTIF
jgi:hypothetical protein